MPQNARNLGLPAITVTRATVTSALAADPTPDRAFDLVLVDPPYDVPEDALAAVLDRLASGWLAEGGLLVVERSTRSPEPTWPAGLTRASKPKKYGETTIWWAERP